MRTVLWICFLAWAGVGLSGVRIEQWSNVPGTEITDALSQGELDRAPDATRMWESFEATTANRPEALSVAGS